MCLRSSEQVHRTYAERNKTLPPSTCLQVMGEIAGVNMASLGGCICGSKTRTRWAEWFHDKHNGHMFNLERDGLHQVVPYSWVTMKWPQTTWPYHTGCCPRLQGPCLLLYTRTEASSILLVHHPRFMEETTAPLAHGTHGHEELRGNSRN